MEVARRFNDVRGGKLRGLPVVRYAAGAMPIYEYELCEGDCKVCGGCFQLNRPANRPPLEKCPLCRKPVRKIVSKFNTPKLTKPLAASDAKKAGFTVFKKVGKGEYERQ